MNRKPPSPIAGRIADSILRVVARIPRTGRKPSESPLNGARAVARVAAIEASAAAGLLAVPPGLAGLVTILPDLVAVWRIQAQMVADIAGCYGESAMLSRETMLYFLFRHSAAQALRDVVVRVGQRQLVRDASLLAMERAAAKIGAKVSQRVIARGISRWLPVVGVLGMAGYAYYDTARVAKTTIGWFENARRTDRQRPTAGRRPV